MVGAFSGHPGEQSTPPISWALSDPLRLVPPAPTLALSPAALSAPCPSPLMES